MPAFDVPPASADATDHADWLELMAVAADDSNVSQQDFISALARTGSVDAVRDADEFDDAPLDDPVEHEGEELERIADAAFERMALRQEYVGHAYPFVVQGNFLQATDDAAVAPYTFLTAVTVHGPLASSDPETGATLFEQVCASALVQYLGGRSKARSYHFGFPRRETPRSFRDALDDLSSEMGEGDGCRIDRPKVTDMKDAKLDVAAWVPFGDGRRNQLSVFGQCAAGQDWLSKIDELQPINFCNIWFSDPPALAPLGAFFVPRQVIDDDWPRASIDHRRILFDRLRISRLLDDIDDDLVERCSEWTVSVVT